MKKLNILIIAVSLLFATTAFSKSEKVIEENFKKVKRIKIELVTGDCVIEKSNDNKVYVRVDHTFDKNEVEFVMETRAGRLTLKEDYIENNARGDSDWNIQIPDDLEVEFNGATGNFAVKNVRVILEGNSGTGNLLMENVAGELDLNSGTGNVKLMNVKAKVDANSGTGSVLISDSVGEFDLNSGTGKVNLVNMEGEMSANSGTGEVKANNITIIDEADFNSGTNDVIVTSPKGKNFKLSVNSGTDDAVVDMNGLPLNGLYELRAHKRRGKIVSSVKFDSEKEEGENGDKYLVKTIKRGNDDNYYYIGTGTGKAKLLE